MIAKTTTQGFDCLTSNSEGNGNDFSQPCGDRRDQRWLVSGNNLVSPNDQCLAYAGESSNFVEKPCTETATQSWSMKNFKMILDTPDSPSSICVTPKGSPVSCSYANLETQSNLADWN